MQVIYSITLPPIKEFPLQDFFLTNTPPPRHPSLPYLSFLPQRTFPSSLALGSQCPQISYQYLLQCMNCLRELPSEYIDLCPTIDQKYRVLFKLGIGRFSQVKLAINLATNQRVAIKLMNHRIDEASLDGPQEQKVMELFLNEVRMTSMARHRNVVQIIDFNVGGLYRTADGKTQRILYYVMKIEEYGELFRVINLTEQFSEKTARYIFRQVLSALRGLHGKRIAHCDIKSENLLMDSKFNVKIVDFGYARHFVDELCQPIEYESSDAVGSLKSNAPELVANGGKGVYQADEIDVFAVGCFLFELVLKAQPFKSADMKDQHYSKLAGMDKKKFWQIFSSKLPPSPQFKDLIEKMLNPNPKERISLQAVMKHPWTNGETPGREDYKKEMGVRVKKVMVKVRKEQELQMKQAFMKEKGKREEAAERFDFQIRRQLQEEIMQLKSMVARDDTGSSMQDDDSVLQEEGGCKMQKKKNGQRQNNIRQ